MEHDENSLFGRATREIDEPIENYNVNDVPRNEELQTYQIQQMEREEKRKDMRYTGTFRLFVGCLIFLGFLFLFDLIANSIVGGGISYMTGEVIEIIKTLLFTLSGYLFAREGSK